MLWRIYEREITGCLFMFESTNNHHNLRRLPLNKMPRDGL